MVNEVVAVLVSFSFIPILTRKRIKFNHILLIVAAILALSSGISYKAFGQAVLNVFSNTSSITTILTVLMVGILGGLMKHYKILDVVVDTLMELINDSKKILMIIPAIMGLLVIPGGALLSAPFVNNIGEDIKLSPARRAAINLVFRHIAMFILPYSTSLLIVTAEMPNLNIFKLIGMNLLFLLFLVNLGYYFFIRDIKVEDTPKDKDVWKSLLNILLYTSPIYVPIVIYAITGWPFYITLIASVFMVYLLGDKKDFAKLTLKSINWNIVLTVVIIFIIKEIILNMEGLLGIFNNMLNINNSMLFIMLVFFISSFFFGYITGNQTAALAIILPMLSQLNAGGNLLYLYVFITFIASFFGYFFSPLHLCQVFTLEYMRVNTAELYREYKFYLPSLFVAALISFLIFGF